MVSGSLVHATCGTCSQVRTQTTTLNSEWPAEPKKGTSLTLVLSAGGSSSSTFRATRWMEKISTSNDAAVNYHDAAPASAAAGAPTYLRRLA